MTQEQMNQTIIERATELLKDKKVNSVYQSFKTETDAKTWIIKSALVTLLYSPEERAAMAERKKSANQRPTR